MPQTVNDQLTSPAKLAQLNHTGTLLDITGGKPAYIYRFYIVSWGLALKSAARIYDSVTASGVWIENKLYTCWGYQMDFTEGGIRFGNGLSLEVTDSVTGDSGADGNVTAYVVYKVGQ